ncbi:META domain-containing protein [Devosia sp. SL43]|uniref:META domain-containing protein n=1 Tax=Devosia sp. SL43 TaxID=2806348 RepID=UPI001F33BB78|nr:META domain-containing protein [Devosia sp. SL43]UJW87063.1 META domain-containing protein [Devosia sp. SL43]
MFVSRLLRTGLALLTLLTLVSAAAADDVTFTGEVTYRERMLLPPDSALTITLVSLPDQSPITSATAVLADRAASPIQFTLNVRSTVLASGGQYGLVAQIMLAGGGSFTNVEPLLVDPADPERNLIEVAFLAPPPHDPPVEILPVEPIEPLSPLLDTAWRVIGIGGDPVLADTEVTLSIAGDRRAGGNGGCNNYFTEASFDLTPLSFGPVAGTRMACTPATMEQEAAYFAALRTTTGYELSGNSLSLVDAIGVPIVELVRLQ